MAKKMLRLIIIGAVLVIGMAAVFIIIKNQKSLTVTGVSVFVDKAAGEIKCIEISNAYGEYQVAYDADEGGYLFADFPVNIVDEEGFLELMNHSCGFGSLKTVEENARDLSVYGLDEPVAKVKVTYFDGKEFSLTIGNSERVSGNYYALVDNGKTVYLFAAEDVEYFLVKKEIFISYQVTPQLLVSSPLSAIRDISFSGTALDQPIDVKAITGADEETVLKAKSFGPATHIVEIQGTYELDQTYGIEILGSVLDIVALDVVGYNLTEEDLSKMGFDEPYMQVDFSLKNNTEYIADYQLKLLPAGEYFYATMKGSGVVFLIEAPKFVTIDYTKLCMRWFLAPLRTDLENVTVEFDDQKYVFVSGSGDDGNWATVNGEELDINLFYSFFRLVTSAASDGIYLDDPKNDGDPLMTITYNYNIEGKDADVMKLYEGSVRRVNVEINGITEFDMKSSFVDAMKNACQNSVEGKSIEENWQ